jgi:hypothetical protein
VKRVLIIAIACCISGGQAPLSGQAEAPVVQKKDVVETARDSKAKRKKSTTKVLTNKDVKKSKGKLIVISTPDAKPDAKKTAAPVTIEQQEERYRARTETKERITTAEKKVGDLERAVTDLEQQYYATNDPTYRDQVIQKRFTQSKRQLDEARQELADLRDSLQKIDQPIP